MPALPNPYRDTDFGAKLDVLEGVIGHLNEAKTFESTTIAAVLGVHRSQIGRKRAGREPISFHHLARLIEHFGLAGRLDYAVFLKPLDEFKAALKVAAIGTYAGRRGGATRQQLYDMASPDEPTGGRCQIAIRPFRHSRRGGFGLAAEDARLVPEFRIGDVVRLHITTPKEAGHLVVLNDQLNTSMTCLMPSCFAPDTAVSGGIVEVPSDDSAPPFDVMAPAGMYRLFAIWTQSAPALGWIENGQADSAPANVPNAALEPFVSGLQKDDAGGLAIAMADYAVIA